ncbi:MAG: hypothetical protein ACTS73_05580 [Arsenophonus sp. NEOnobi-MAG3]
MKSCLAEIRKTANKALYVLLSKFSAKYTSAMKKQKKSKRTASILRLPVSALAGHQ